MKYSKPQVIGMKMKIPKNPIIEILGAPSIGKTQVLKYLGLRTVCPYVSLPNVALSCISGRALSSSLDYYTDDLEKNPYWWFHMYAANILENIKYIENLREESPVFISGYYWGYLHWFRCALNNCNSSNLGLRHHLNFLDGIEKPEEVFILKEPVCKTIGRDHDFSFELISKIASSIHNAKVGITVDYRYISDPYLRINHITDTICEYLFKKYGMRYNNVHLATRGVE